MRTSCTAALAIALSWSFTAQADVANNEDIDKHVDAVLARVDVRSLSAEQKQALLADRLALNFGVAIPVLGSVALETKVYGEVRPAAVVFDWILGGLIPAGLALTALAGRSALAPTLRTDLAWTALALYGATRVGILVFANLHISEYNRRMTMGLAAAAPDGRLGPALVVRASW